MLCLYVQAPFAAFRTFTAGSFRPTASFITPSAAYGLLLNLAGIEMRAPDDGQMSMTLIQGGLPPLEVALGALSLPEQHTVFQQLHNYPVGPSGAEHAPNTKGNKYNIVPARRAVLTGLRAYVCLRGGAELEQRIVDGLAGKYRRYGIPFLGDSNFLPDRIDVIEQDQLQPAHWFVKVGLEGDPKLSDSVTRLTVTIDRADMSRTASLLFCSLSEQSKGIPEPAWTTVHYS
ncbi:MAG: type I-MYXAN CRISPR-associated protein Cas5/Cmx5/DevS [Gammaproteobacteria bacterium]|nr:MAG: type I-MYXAN CRISPR-associated protein Cas5/Cmx5/DevS [Gammaproteobacteria bacterium]